MQKLAVPYQNFFDIFFPAFLLFGHKSRYVKISTEGCRIRLRKHHAFAIFGTCFWVIFVIYVSRISKNCVGSFDKMEKFKKFPVFWYITWAKTLYFKGFMADSMMRTHPFPHFVKKKLWRGTLSTLISISYKRTSSCPISLRSRMLYCSNPVCNLLSLTCLFLCVPSTHKCLGKLYAKVIRYILM